MNSDWGIISKASQRACLLCISAPGHTFILIVLQQDTSEGVVAYVFNDVPLYRKAASPFILAPKIHVVLVVDRANHLSNSTEIGTSVDLWDHIIVLSNSSSRTWNQMKEVKCLKFRSTHWKEQKNWAQGRTTSSYSLSLSECSIQLLVSNRGSRPHTILDRFVNIWLIIGLYNKEFCIWIHHLEIISVILISPNDYLTLWVANKEPWCIGFYNYFWGHRTHWHFCFTSVLLSHGTQPSISIAAGSYIWLWSLSWQHPTKVRSNIWNFIVVRPIRLQWRPDRRNCHLWRLLWCLMIVRRYVNMIHKRQHNKT